MGKSVGNIQWAILFALVLLAYPANGQELRVDIGQAIGGTPTPEDGYQAFTANTSATVSNNYAAAFGTGGGGTVTVDITAPFYRGVPATYPQVTGVPGFNDLLSGAALMNNNPSPQTMTLDLTNLADGDYAITTFHHTNYINSTGLASIDISLTDAINAGVLQHAAVPVTAGAAPANFTTRVTNFTVAGGSATTLTFDGMGPSGGAEHANLNAFIINDITAGLPALNVDFGAADNVGGGPGGTQTGFQAFEGTNNGSDVPNASRFIPSLYANNGLLSVDVTGSTHYRDYTSLSGGNAAFGENALLSDMVLRNSDGEMTLMLDNLLAGTYEITTFHHSTQFGGGTFDVELTDSSVTDMLLFDDASVSAGTDPASISSLSFQFTTDGSPVAIDFLGGAGGQHLSLNGFSLQQVAVPEPASVAIWTLFGLACVGMYRIRRTRTQT